MSRERSTGIALLAHPRLPVGLVLVGVVLTAPSLLLGFHLDDHVHRLLLSERAAGRALADAYESPFGIANGEPASNHWQVETGYAPWWMHPELLISLLRPVSELTHRLDATLWPDGALAQHAHSLAWYALLVFAAALLYRGIAGHGAVAGLAALLYTVDHTHGFAVGWIANRNAIVSAAFGVLALLLHHRGRMEGSRAAAIAAPLFFALALFAGEGAVAIGGYLLAHALFVDRAAVALGRRLLALVPAGAVVVLWRVAYAVMGRGAHGSGLYVDPAQEPLRFTLAVVERAPVLLLGELALPPAEAYPFAPPEVAPVLWSVAAVASLAFVACALPLVRVDRIARFWAFGAAAALVPACATHPNNRLLFFVGLGVLGLLARLWRAMVTRETALAGTGPLGALARWFVGAVLGLHLFVSPVLLPLAACSIALTAPVERAARALLDDPDARGDLVLVTSPDYYVPKLVRVLGALEGGATPGRLRALSFGESEVSVERVDARTLELAWPDGILTHPLLELYRARDLPMPAGTRVRLDGLTIDVLATTTDGRPRRARFTFDDELDAGRTRWRYWDGDRYATLSLPAVGEQRKLPPARIPFGL